MGASCCPLPTKREHQVDRRHGVDLLHMSWSKRSAPNVNTFGVRVCTHRLDYYIADLDVSSGMLR